ncbi:hypothetical protein JW960_14945 [candidate division KSB1 bacterium]|nr:hypothetical protein [candidate division KSB1 bacterium]
MKQLIYVGIKTGNQLTLRFQRPAALTLNLAAQTPSISVNTGAYRSIGSILADMIDLSGEQQ